MAPAAQGLLILLVALAIVLLAHYLRWRLLAYCGRCDHVTRWVGEPSDQRDAVCCKCGSTRKADSGADHCPYCREKTTIIALKEPAARVTCLGCGATRYVGKVALGKERSGHILLALSSLVIVLAMFTVAATWGWHTRSEVQKDHNPAVTPTPVGTATPIATATPVVSQQSSLTANTTP